MYDSSKILPFHIQTPADMKPHCDEKCLVVVIFKAFYRYIFAKCHAGLDFHAHVHNRLYLCPKDVAWQAILRNPNSHHPSCNGKPFKDRNTIPFNGQKIGCCESCGTCSDNGDFIFLPGFYFRDIAFVL